MAICIWSLKNKAVSLCYDWDGPEGGSLPYTF